MLLLEGGGFDFDPRMQDLYRGEKIGLPYFPIQSARPHLVVGTTGHCAGFCSTMDPLDFAVRDWVPRGGWSIPRSELDPYYKRAALRQQLIHHYRARERRALRRPQHDQEAGRNH